MYLSILSRITNQIFLENGLTDVFLIVSSYDWPSLGNLENQSPKGEVNYRHGDLNTDSQASAVVTKFTTREMK